MLTPVQVDREALDRLKALQVEREEERARLQAELDELKGRNLNDQQISQYKVGVLRQMSRSF